MRLSQLAAPLSICAVALAACGGDDSLSAEEYRAQGNAACDRYERDVGALEQPQSVDEVPEYAEQAAARLTELIDELDALAPPDDLADGHEELVGLGRDSTAKLEELQAVADGEPEELQQVLEQASELDGQSDALARELGLDACADQS